MKIKPHPITFIQTKTFPKVLAKMFGKKTKRKKQSYPEYNLQCECVKWFKLSYPKVVIFSMPNERKVTAYAMQRLLKSGLLPGVPDLFMAYPNKDFNGLFIEMKSAKGKLSDNQKKVHTDLSEYYAVVTCYSFDSFQETIEKYFNNAL